MHLYGLPVPGAADTFPSELGPVWAAPQKPAPLQGEPAPLIKELTQKQQELLEALLASESKTYLNFISGYDRPVLNAACVVQKLGLARKVPSDSGVVALFVLNGIFASYNDTTAHCNNTAYVMSSRPFSSCPSRLACVCRQIYLVAR